MSGAEEALGRAEDLLGELAEIAKQVEAELERARREAGV